MVTVPFAIPRSGRVEIGVYNILGQSVYRSAQFYPAGGHVFRFQSSLTGSELNSGVYLVRMVYGDQTQVRKVMLVK